MTDDIETIDLSDEQQNDSYEPVYRCNGVNSSFKKPLNPVTYASPSGFPTPQSLNDIIAQEKALPWTSEEEDIPIRSKGETRERKSRPATSPFAQQRPRSSKSTSPNQGDFGKHTAGETTSMAYSPEATPGKKRRINSATNTLSSDARPQWPSNSPFPTYKDTDANALYRPITPDCTPVRAPPAPHGMFSKQARSQRNGIQAALQPPPPSLDSQAAGLTTALSQAEHILNNLDSLIIRPMNDMAKELNTVKDEVRQARSENKTLKTENQNLKNELTTLRQHVDDYFTDRASKTQKAVSDVNANVEELHVRVDDLEGDGEPVPEGAYGGPRMTGPARQPSVFNGLPGFNDGA